MKDQLSVVMLVGLAACAVPEVETAEVESAATTVTRGCPEPDTCIRGNGNGVYAEENGTIGIGPRGFVILHFVNTSQGVGILGAYLHPTLGWQVRSGSVIRATYQLISQAVVSVGETLTKPTWNLAFAGPVTGADINGMTVDVFLDDDTEINYYTVRFSSYAQSIPEPGTQIEVQTARAGWKPTRGTDPYQAYCRRGNDTEDVDPIVFQQGIGVNVASADVARNGNFVTMSCLHGGPATVRRWGYSYRNNSNTPDIFDAALHMKRASYCGDASFYTESGTNILIHDYAGVNTDSIPPATMEASWDIHGAVCVNMPNRRHRNAFWPVWTTDVFDPMHCADGHQIPVCGNTLGPGLIASRANPPSD